MTAAKIYALVEARPVEYSESRNNVVWLFGVPPRTDPDTVRTLFLKESPELDLPVDTIDRKEIRRDFSRIRCPLCHWTPSSDSRWSCVSFGSPEPPFDACGTVWNTFATHGKCPGCEHQWTWTTCLKCGMASKHDEWYEEQSDT